MSIVCGIDFSEFSLRAADVAGDLAARLKLPLHLVHVLADWYGDADSAEKVGLNAVPNRALEVLGTKLREKGIEVHIRIELDPPAESLIRVAEEVSATFLVVGATGRGSSGGRPVGRTADLVAQQGHTPVLAVRNAETFQAWMRGERALRVLVGLDFNVVSDEAWCWATDLARVGFVELIGTYVYCPPDEFHRLGIGGLRSYVDADPEVDKVLRGELEARFPGEHGVNTRIRMEPNMGLAADRLLSVATEEKADLIVVGSHQRSTITRLWEGSVSRGVLHYANTSVACVPLPTRKRAKAAPAVRKALVATDFSVVGNAAIAHAYGQVGPGGTVYLVHVIAPPSQPSQLEARDIFKVSTASEQTKVSVMEQLQLLVPVTSAADFRDKGTETIVLESRDTAEAIAQAADRLGVDVICLGTHGRGGVARAVLGSVAHAVLVKTLRPVLLVRAPEN